MLFVHGTSLKSFANLCDSGVLLDRGSRHRTILPHQEALGTQRSVYFSVSAVYPAREVALVMTLDPATVLVSPWDTGAFWTCPSLTSGLHADVYQEHTLTDPAWRDYFAGRMVETFDDPRRYFQSKHSDHDHAASHGCRRSFFSSVFEARADGPVQLKGRVIALIYPELPGTVGHHATVIGAANRLKKEGASVLTYRRNEGPPLREVFYQWMMEKLQWR